MSTSHSLSLPKAHLNPFYSNVQLQKARKTRNNKELPDNKCHHKGIFTSWCGFNMCQLSQLPTTLQMTLIKLSYGWIARETEFCLFILFEQFFPYFPLCLLLSFLLSSFSYFQMLKDCLNVCFLLVLSLTSIHLPFHGIVDIVYISKVSWRKLCF